MMEKWNPQKVRESIYAFMKARDLKHRDWCTKAGLSRQALEKFLKGETEAPALDTLWELARVENVTVATLIGEACPLPHAETPPAEPDHSQLADAANRAITQFLADADVPLDNPTYAKAVIELLRARAELHQTYGCSPRALIVGAIALATRPSDANGGKRWLDLLIGRLTKAPST